MVVICSPRWFLININSHPVHSVFWQIIRSEGMAKHTDLQILNNLITGLFSVWSCLRHEFRREHQCGPAPEAGSGARAGSSAGGEQGRLIKPFFPKLDSNGSQYQLMWVTAWRLLSHTAEFAANAFLREADWQRQTERSHSKGRMH